MSRFVCPTPFSYLTPDRSNLVELRHALPVLPAPISPVTNYDLPTFELLVS